MRADEHHDHGAGLVEGVAPGVTGAVLHHGVAGAELLGDTVVELEHDAARDDELVVDARGRVHTGVIGLHGPGHPGERLLDFDEGRLDGIIGMGGTGGSTVVASAMRPLPVGVPKVCVSTAASGDTSAYVGTKDVTMIPSIVDVAGINRVSRMVFTRAAGAICGMVESEVWLWDTEVLALCYRSGCRV